MITLKISAQALKDMKREVVEYGGSWSFMRDDENKNLMAHNVVMNIIQRFVDDQLEQKGFKDDIK